MKVKDLAERARQAETKAAQNEARAAQAEARAKDFQARASGGGAASQANDVKLKAAEAKTATLEKEVKALQEQEQHLKGRLQELEDREPITATNVVPGLSPVQAQSSAELEKLKTENANLKKKLMQAETAIEAAASLRARVAKLEAQLKGGAAPVKK
jgi:DNA repair exonuclease SbcCD ATPase subunit